MWRLTDYGATNDVDGSLVIRKELVEYLAFYLTRNEARAFAEKFVAERNMEAQS